MTTSIIIINSEAGIKEFSIEFTHIISRGEHIHTSEGDWYTVDEVHFELNTDSTVSHRTLYVYKR